MAPNDGLAEREHGHQLTVRQQRHRHDRLQQLQLAQDLGVEDLGRHRRPALHGQPADEAVVRATAGCRWTSCGARPRLATMRNSCPRASGRSSAMRVGRTSSPMESRNIPSTRGRSNAGGQHAGEAAQERAPTAAPSHGSPLAGGRRPPPSAPPPAVAAISRTSRWRSSAWRSTASSSRAVKPSETVKSALSSSSPLAPTAITSASGVTSRAAATNVARAPAGPVLSRSTMSMSTSRRVRSASLSLRASKMEKAVSERLTRARSASSAVRTRTVFTRSPPRSPGPAETRR